MARIKSRKYNGVYLNLLSSGDTSYTITYKDEVGKKVFYKIGLKSEGITEVYAYNKRNEYINQMRLGEDPLAKKKKQTSVSLEDLAKVYFDDKRCMRCEQGKEFIILSNSAKEINTTLVCGDRKVKHQYNKYVKHLQPKFGSTHIASLKKDSIQKLRQALQAQEKSANTI